MRTVIMAVLLLAGTAAHAAPPEPPAGIVFFTEWSALLQPDAQDIVRQAETVVRAHPERRVLVEGYADTTGTHEADRLLSKLRARVVVDLMIADGIPAERLTLIEHGQTPDSGVKTESRRVVISLAATG